MFYARQAYDSAVQALRGRVDGGLSGFSFGLVGGQLLLRRIRYLAHVESRIRRYSLLQALVRRYLHGCKAGDIGLSQLGGRGGGLFHSQPLAR